MCWQRIAAPRVQQSTSTLSQDSNGGKQNPHRGSAERALRCAAQLPPAFLRPVLLRQDHRHSTSLPWHHQDLVAPLPPVCVRAREHADQPTRHAQVRSRARLNGNRYTQMQDWRARPLGTGRAPRGSLTSRWSPPTSSASLLRHQARRHSVATAVPPSSSASLSCAALLGMCAPVSSKRYLLAERSLLVHANSGACIV